MGVIGAGYPTLLDMAKRTDPNGSIAGIVEALTQRNPILMDAMAMEGNLPTGHRCTIRAGLPTVGWRRFNQGVARSKSTTIQIDENIGMLNGQSFVDCDLAELNGNEAAFRASEDISFLQAMNNEVAATLFYGNSDLDPEEFMGLTPRYNNISGNDNSGHVLDSGVGTGTGSDQASIWFVTWGPDTAYLVYPKGSTAGLTPTPMGKQLVEDGADSDRYFLAWVTDWKWKVGLVVKDWRYHVRIGDIDTGDWATTEIELIDQMIEAYNRVYDLNVGRTVIYMNRTVKSHLDKTIYNKDEMHFTPAEWHGRQVDSFRGIPILTCDALSIVESAMTA